MKSCPLNRYVPAHLRYQRRSIRMEPAMGTLESSSLTLYVHLSTVSASLQRIFGTGYPKCQPHLFLKQCIEPFKQHSLALPVIFRASQMLLKTHPIWRGTRLIGPGRQMCRHWKLLCKAFVG